MNPNLEHLLSADSDFFEGGLQLGPEHAHRLLPVLVLDGVLAPARNHQGQRFRF